MAHFHQNGINPMNPPEVGKIYQVQNSSTFWKNYDRRESFWNDFLDDNVHLPLGKWFLIVKIRHCVNRHETYWLFKIVFGEDIGWVRSNNDNWELDFARVYDVDGTRPF